MPVTQEIVEMLLSLERELLLPSTRHDPARLRALLDPDFEEVGASGRVYGLDAIVQALGNESSSPEPVVAVEAFRACSLAPDVVQVRYRSRSAERGIAERTSIWRNGNAGWTMLFHQGTPLPVSER